ncbi:MAG: protein kinase [Paramuribaculum sp.]|nr:protein kinase [Paramuribaculum sp.]
MAEKSENKWTEIELLPEWDEEFYDIYTAKKHGKWVMLKTLKPQYKEDPRFRSIIEKEFDVRYNLAHPHIVMINDFEEVPGLGMCIITDDVYGKSLKKLLDAGEVTEQHLDKVCHQLVDAIEYIQLNHLVHFPIRPETIIFTENIENLKLIDVGFDQRQNLTPAEATEDIYNFGLVLTEVLKAVHPAPTYLKKVAEKCCNPDPRMRYKSVHQLRMALARRSNNKFYIYILIFLLVMMALLFWVSSSFAPEKI